MKKPCPVCHEWTDKTLKICASNTNEAISVGVCHQCATVFINEAAQEGLIKVCHINRFAHKKALVAHRN